MVEFFGKTKNNYKNFFNLKGYKAYVVGALAHWFLIVKALEDLVHLLQCLI